VDPAGSRWVAEPGADDKPEGVVLGLEDCPQVRVGLPERQIEGGALDGPPAVAPKRLAFRWFGKQRDPLEVRREPVELVLAGEIRRSRRPERVVIRRLVGDVLPAADRAASGGTTVVVTRSNPLETSRWLPSRSTDSIRRGRAASWSYMDPDGVGGISVPVHRRGRPDSWFGPCGIYHEPESPERSRTPCKRTTHDSS